MLIPKLSWKNVWRNPVRSGVVICAVIIGTWAGIFISAFSSGMTRQYLQTELDTYTGHIQIHTPEYLDEHLPQDAIPHPSRLEQDLKSSPNITKVADHTVVDGLARSSANTFGVTVTGIDPDQEKSISTVHTYVTEGGYFDGKDRRPVLVGRKLADKLNLRLRSKLVLNFQDVNNEITGGAFRVAGIFKTPNTSFDEMNVFVRASDLKPLLEADTLVHEMVVRVDNFKKAPHYADSLQAVYPNLRIRSWRDVAPELSYMDSMMDITLYIFITVLILALTLGIINTMLMAVMERTRELGMLMAVGMNHSRVFGMILSETFYLIFVGTPAGLLLGWITVWLTGTYGIDLSAFSAGLSSYGFSTVIHPSLDGIYYLNVGLMMAAASVIAAVYPAYKALKLKPVEAIRKI